MDEQSYPIRCPFGKLFVVMISRGEKITPTSDNLVEVACPDCKRAVKSLDHTVHRILHRYDVVGTLVETVVQRPGYVDQVFAGSEWSASDITSELRAP